MTNDIDVTTGLPEVPEGHYWSIEHYHYDWDMFEDDGWRVRLMRRKWKWWMRHDRVVASSGTFTPEYEYEYEAKRRQVVGLEPTFELYLLRIANEVLDKAFKRTPKDLSREKWLGEYPPKKVSP